MSNLTAAPQGYIGGESQAKEVAMLSHRNTTLSQNIQNHIRNLQDQIERLQAVHVKLQSGNILDVPIEDLRQAMQY